MSWKAGFQDLTGKAHSAQAKWWLNGFWNKGAEQVAESIWDITHVFIETDLGEPLRYGSKKQEIKEGCDLDEFKAHQVLEKLGETLTVKDLRTRLRKLDIDANNRMALTEYLVDKYAQSPEELVNAPQGTLDQTIIDDAQAKCDAAEEAMNKAVTAEAPLKKANEALDVIVAEIRALEKTKADTLERLDKIANDPTAGNVKKGKAANERQQLLAEDSLPLQKAKITQEAALKRVEKARAPFIVIRVAAVDAFKIAEEALQELKKMSGTPHGTIWWMERVLAEKKKFMPRK